MIRIGRSIDDRGHKIDHLSSVMRFKRRVYNAFYRTPFFPRHSRTSADHPQRRSPSAFARRQTSFSENRFFLLTVLIHDGSSEAILIEKLQSSQDG